MTLQWTANDIMDKKIWVNEIAYGQLITEDYEERTQDNSMDKTGVE